MKARISLILPVLQLALLLFPFVIAKNGGDHVDLVMSLDQYYDAVNSNSSYTMVEYTTSWCHHCKKLAPNFVKLMKSYENDTIIPGVKFLEVNCEIFGSTICRGFPGFPMIHLIQPRTDPLDLQADDWKPLSFWQRILKVVTGKYTDPRWQLEQRRIIEYRGSRDAEAMKTFVEAVRAKDKLVRMVDRVMDASCDCDKEDEEDARQLCNSGKQYMKETVAELSTNGIAKEHMRLENIIKNNPAAENINSAAYTSVLFKLEILDRLPADTNDDRDEL